jgi:hypothetical protein
VEASLQIKPSAETAKALGKKNALLKEMEQEYLLWLPHFRELADFFLPRNYAWLTRHGVATGISSPRPTAANRQTSKILNSASTEALRVLAHGLMNGITSPARPWFRLGIVGHDADSQEIPRDWSIWLEEATRRQLLVMAESNYYNAKAVQYLDLALFGVGATLIYEDFEDVIRCYNSPVGEFNIAQSNRKVVDVLSRVMSMTVRQLVQEFGEDACSDQVKEQYKKGDAALLTSHTVHHLIEPNLDDGSPYVLSSSFKFREIYWEAGQTDGRVLRLAGFRENPVSCPRWEVTGNDTYGTSPAMDALADVKQLQVAAKQRIVAKDKMNRPPIVADRALKGDPTAFLPGGVSFVPSASTVGAKPIYTVQPPLQEMTQEILELIDMIRRTLYNNLFRNISNLDTTRTATEIAARQAEDLVLLGPVLERNESEALSVEIKRIFSIMLRKNLFPPLPPNFPVDSLDIRYISILADAQRASTTGAIERYMGAIGQLAGAFPDILTAVDSFELLSVYGERLGVPAKITRSREQIEAEKAAQQGMQEMAAAAQIGKDVGAATQSLASAEVGTGASALDQIMGL